MFEASKKEVKNSEPPKTRYFFGDDNDFQLQQAVHVLKGEPYVTGFESKAVKTNQADKKSVSSSNVKNKKIDQ